MMDTRYMQKCLRLYNYDVGPIDGRPGIRTIKALMQFQADNGIKPDGRPGPITQACFEKVIKELQVKLKERGFNPGPIDGVYGGMTSRALVEYQRHNGLIADGIVGPRTVSSFAGVYLPPKPPAVITPNGKNVVLDAGHGGYDPGACGNGLREKDITLAITLKTRDILSPLGFNVKLTRDGDYAPGHYEGNINAELNERVRISEEFMGANGLFVSIHLNSFGDVSVDGTETLMYAPGGQGEKAANIMQNELLSVTGANNRKVKAQAVLVLRKTTCPAILTESVFISSQNESNRLRQEAFITALAQAHAKGICNYFGV